MKTAFNLPEQVRSLSRFPIPVAIATSLAVLLNLRLAHVIHLSEALESELIFACAGAFLASFAAQLWDQPKSQHQRQSRDCAGGGRCRRCHPVFSRRLAKGDALRAVYDEDQPRQQLVEFPQLGDQIRAWLVAADKHLNPPPPKSLDPSMQLVRFTKSFPGRGASSIRKSITAFSIGETAAFGRAEVDFLFELGVVELVSPETTDEEAA